MIYESCNTHLCQTEALPPRSPGCVVNDPHARGRVLLHAAAAPRLCWSEVLSSRILCCGESGGALAGVWASRKFRLPKRPRCWPGLYAGPGGPSSGTIGFSCCCQKRFVVGNRGTREPGCGFPEVSIAQAARMRAWDICAASLPVFQIPGS
jgi:hypothetical protein